MHTVFIKYTTRTLSHTLRYTRNTQMQRHTHVLTHTHRKTKHTHSSNNTNATWTGTHPLRGAPVQGLRRDGADLLDQPQLCHSISGLGPKL